MDTHDKILSELRSEGFRLTKARKAIVMLFSQADSPLSSAGLVEGLLSEGIKVNRTTVYREVDFLIKRKLIKEVQVGDGKRRFELWPEHHHHHLVCVKCSDVQCVELKKCLSDEQADIERDNSFKVTDHSIKFFGLCVRCQ